MKAFRTGIRALCTGLSIAVLLLSCGCFAHASDDWTLAVASDLHYIAPALTDGGAYYQALLRGGDSKFMPWIDEILSAFEDEMLELRPDALLLTGDLSFNGAVMSHEALAGHLQKLEEAGIPVLVLTGNHDVYNVNAASFHGDGFTRVPFAVSETFDAVYEDFGVKESLSRDSDSLSCMVPLNATTRLLLLDFNTIHDFCGVSETTLRWVERQLRDARDAGVEVIAAGHQNLFQHTVFYDNYVIDRADRLTELLRSSGVRLFLSGHLHIQHVQTEEGLTEITTSALCSYPCQYGILSSESGKLNYRTKQLDMKAWAERHGRTEAIFQDFQAAAADYMISHFSAAVPAGENLEDWTEELEWLRRVNLGYFAGDLREAAALDPDGSLASRWLSANDLTSRYVATVVDALGEDHTRWSEGEAVLP